jgi:uncharacterized membrane protein YgdD (TMEM256/DUF423 family)
MAWGVLGALSGFLAVAAGAFGAHALRESMPPDRLAVFETAARYQLVHALALIATAWAAERRPSLAATLAGALFVAGTLLFSASLYALAWSGLRAWGAVTPFGGLCLLGGWLALARALAGPGRR